MKVFSDEPNSAKKQKTKLVLGKNDRKHNLYTLKSINKKKLIHLPLRQRFRRSSPFPFPNIWTNSGFRTIYCVSNWAEVFVIGPKPAVF